MHIDEGWLEIFMYEAVEAIDAPLKVDKIFECFVEAWQTIGIEADQSRWADDLGVTLYMWEPPLTERDRHLTPEVQLVRTPNTCRWKRHLGAECCEAGRETRPIVADRCGGRRRGAAASTAVGAMERERNSRLKRRDTEWTLAGGGR